MTESPTYHCQELGIETTQDRCSRNYDKALGRSRQNLPLGRLSECLACNGSKMIERETMAEKGKEAEVPAALIKFAEAGDRRTVILEALDRAMKKANRSWVFKKELATELGVPAPNLNHHLKPMVEGGYIEIVPGKGPTDPVKIQYGSPPTIKPNGDQNLKEEIVNPTPIPICKICQEEPAVVDSIGRNMGRCKKCMAEVSKGNLALGHKKSWTPVYVPLNDPRFQDIRDWIMANAEELVQDIPQQIMYQLKLAHRRAQAVNE